MSAKDFIKAIKKYADEACSRILDMHMCEQEEFCHAMLDGYPEMPPEQVILDTKTFGCNEVRKVMDHNGDSWYEIDIAGAMPEHPHIVEPIKDYIVEHMNQLMLGDRLFTWELNVIITEQGENDD